MQLSPTFHDDTAGRSPRRVSFMFGVNGTQQIGITYVTMNVDADPMGYAAKAAKVAAKRAGCDAAEVTLRRIVAPVR